MKLEGDFEKFIATSVLIVALLFLTSSTPWAPVWEIAL
tara:strand:+ start:866 stop:979 length:114 start_codon:yes stop_codon:yes gene_type:complete